MKTATMKLRWLVGQEDDAKRLQTYLSVHVGTVNILLVEYGLERMHVNEEKAGSTAQ
jgi:hypothetical protein